MKLSRWPRLQSLPVLAGPTLAFDTALWDRPRLRLLSFNIQAGMAIHAPHHYFTRGLRHVWAHHQQPEHLGRIAQLVSGFDVVALQEVDGGSLRSGYTHQLAHLAEQAGFPYWYQQTNRNLGHLGQFGNGLLSRRAPAAVNAYTLPGVPGRGVICSRFGPDDAALYVLNVHLALGAAARARQLAFIHELIADASHVVMMGDLNCSHEEVRRSPLGQRAWQWREAVMPTYPSWKPSRQIDHILVSTGLAIHTTSVLNSLLSDHRPLALELELPATLCALPATLSV